MENSREWSRVRSHVKKFGSSGRLLGAGAAEAGLAIHWGRTSHLDDITSTTADDDDRACSPPPHSLIAHHPFRPPTLHFTPSTLPTDSQIDTNMSDPSTSYAAIPSPASEIDSLPSSSAGSTTSISPSEEEYISDAEREWRESLQQLELLLTMVLVPYLGKYFGRRCAYWGKSTILWHGGDLRRWGIDGDGRGRQGWER